VEDAQIVFAGLDDPESESLLNYQGLYGYIKKRLCEGRLTHVFIDDIQRCADYEKAVEGLLIKRQIALYVTASNSGVFSRMPYTAVRMLPLSFSEYMVFSRAKILGQLGDFSPPVGGGAAQEAKPERRLPRHRAQLEKHLRREAFNNYVSFGGFPFTAALGGDAALIRQCVDGIYNTILVKDVARQAGINDIPLLERIAQMMSQSAGSPLNSKKLSAAISAKGRKISANTVETYMRALVSAFVFYHVERYDLKTEKRLKTLGKYYIADTGIRNLLLGAAPDLNGQLENVVCLELLRRGFEVCIGKCGGDEVSFVAFAPPAEKGEKQAYFQVAASVRDSAVLAGKLSPLEQIPDSHPKYILSLDETPFRSSRGGITQRNLIDWLLDTKR